MASCPSCALEVLDGLQFCPRCGATLTDPLLGSVLGDRYRVISRIGIGGMGVVYRAQHITLKRDLAVKVLLPEFGGKEEFVRRFEREAESASRLAHPHIIAVTDFGRTADGLLFLAMEYLDGRSLSSLIREGPLPVARAVTIVRQMLAALNRAHAAGIVHRDLKPDNIMLIDREGHHYFVKILDFGIAKVTEPEPGREALTQAGVVFGTPEYLSPEQALGDKIDARADLYATGVILFEMLTGRRPFESEDKMRIISMHLSHPVPRMRSVRPGIDVPPALEDVVMQALEKERENRFASASAFLMALEEAERLAAERGAASSYPAEHLGGGRDARPPPLPGPGASPLTGLAPPTAGEGPGAPAAFAPSAGASRSRRTLLLVAAGGAVLLLAVVAIPKALHKSAPGARVAKPAPAAGELAVRIRVVEGLLANGDIVKARLSLEQLLSENPRSGRVRYLMGRVAFADDRHAEALADYRQAIELEPGFRGDPVLIEHLGVALGEPKLADAALDLAIDEVGKPAADLLLKIANGGGELRRRERAARALEDLGEGKRVDMVALRIAQLKRTGTCEDKRPLVVALGKSDDLRALPVLRAQRQRGGLDGLLGNEPPSGCMKTELGEAIARLEAQLPADKRPAPQPAGAAGAHKTSARSSFFRGR